MPSYSELFTPQFFLLLGEVFWLNIILSGDNAVVIALACRGLPAKQRRWGIVLGAAVAIVLRLIFLVVLGTLLKWPLLKVVGGVLLFYIAVKLVTEDGHGDGQEAADGTGGPTTTLGKAIWTVALADIVMSLDNVLAIAGVAENATGVGEVQKLWLYIIGIGTSIPLIIVGSALISAIVARFPIFVWAGAALLGFVAGEMIATDPLVELVALNQQALHGSPIRIGTWQIAGPEFNSDYFKLAFGIAGALFVVLLGLWINGRRRATAVRASSRAAE